MTATVPASPPRRPIRRDDPFGKVRAALVAARDERTRWPFFDGARGVAIIAVVAFHGLRYAGDWYSPKIASEGVPPILWVTGTARFAIDLFFVLSGFLITWTWWQRRNRSPRLRPAVTGYARARALRVLPVFWVSLLVFIPWRAPDLLTRPTDLALFATVQQYLRPALPEEVNVVTWSLTTEVHFYLLLPLLVLLVRNRTGALAALAGTIALSVWWFGARGDLPSSLILGRLDQFVAGMAVAVVYRRHVDGARSWLVRAVCARGVGWFLGAALVALGTYHGVKLGIPLGSEVDAWIHPLAGLILAGLGLRLLCQPAPGRLRRFLERPTLLVLGAMSYSIYLWHVPFMEFGLETFRPLGWPFAATGLGLGLATLAALAVSTVSYAYVERPFMQRKTRKARRAEAGEAAERERAAVTDAATPVAPSPGSASDRATASR